MSRAIIITCWVLLIIAILALTFFVVFAERINREGYQRDSEIILGRMHNLLTKHNIPYAITCGTLLGAVRDGSFIVHDHDVDIIIFEEDVQSLKGLKEEMERNGLRIHFGTIHQVDLIHESGEPSYSYLDIFVMRDAGDRYEYLEEKNRKTWKNDYMMKEELFPMREYTINDLTVMGPNDAIPILSRQYGDWKTRRKELRLELSFFHKK